MQRLQERVLVLQEAYRTVSRQNTALQNQLVWTEKLRSDLEDRLFQLPKFAEPNIPLKSDENRCRLIEETFTSRRLKALQDENAHLHQYIQKIAVSLDSQQTSHSREEKSETKEWLVSNREKAVVDRKLKSAEEEARPRWLCFVYKQLRGILFRFPT